MSSPSRTADLVALVQTTDANGHVDLTAYQAQRLILLHQSIQGVDAPALVDALVNSPAYATAEGRDQIGPLIRAISDRLPLAESWRFAHALDAANVDENRLERIYEDYVEAPLSSAAGQASRWTADGLAWTDQQISDGLAATKRWAENARQDPQNGYLERAAATLASDGVGTAQTSYGAMKGATRHGLELLGDTVDLAMFAQRFSTDRDFRNLIIGAAAIYASDAAHDPMKPVDDIARAARTAWNEWEAGYENALRAGKGQQYLGEAGGAAAIEIIATFVPASKLTQLGKVARAVDAADELAPAGQAAGRAGSRATGTLAAEVAELASDAARVQARGGVEAAGADLAFNGLAGVKRSQGELRELVEGLRKTGDVDGLLRSGALAPRELNYLARQDLALFDGEVPFHQALNAYVGRRALSELKDYEVGDIGEAVLAHDLARKGYRDLVPIQNNSGHGNDLVGINPDTGRWEVFEVKASVQGIARSQHGAPLEIITSRFEKADEARGFWAPKNMWEEQARSTAERILDEALDPITRKLDVDPKWARINIERDPVSGELLATPQIDPWKSPADRKLEREQHRGAAEPQTPPPSAAAQSAGQDGTLVAMAPSTHFGSSPGLPADLRDPNHPGHASFGRTLSEVHRMEDAQGIPRGPDSEKLAAALCVAAEQCKQGITNVERGADGQIHGILRTNAFQPEQRVSIDPAQALSETMQGYALQWAQARSPHYAEELPAAGRTQEQARILASLSPGDQQMFGKLRSGTPHHITDETVVNALYAARKAGICDAAQIGQVGMIGDRLMIGGATPGFYAAVDVSQPQPSMREAAAQLQTFDHQQALDQRQEQQRAQSGPTRSV